MTWSSSLSAASRRNSTGGAAQRSISTSRSQATLRTSSGRYADWLRNAKPHELADGLTIVVAAPADILRSKEAAGRDKDLEALPQMRRDFEDAGSL